MDTFKFLIIDDNADDRALILRAMRREFPRLEAREAMDPLTFAHSVEQGGYDLVTVDYQLNWSTGLDLLPMLKERLPGCPVIMFTATGNEEVAVRAMKAGVDDYVLKSSRHFVQLAAAAHAVLGRERQRRRADFSEQRLQDLLSNLDVGVYRADGSGALLDANPAFLRIMGMESLGRAQGWTLHEAVPDAKAFSRIQNDLRFAGMTRCGELRVRTRDGRIIWISLALKYSFEDRHSLEGMIEDITDRKRLDAALRGKEEELRNARRLESMGRLAGGVAHDFNNLMTAINGYSELLLEKMDDGEPDREWLLEIRQAGARAAALTQELLAFGRRQIFQPSRLDLNEMLAAAEPDIRRTLGDGIALELCLGFPLRKIMIDRRQLETVIQNLVQNALEAMPRGGTLILATKNFRIREGEFSQAFESDYTGVAEPVRPGEYISLTVEDSGTGMDERTVARLFEPFFTTKPAGKGLGLAAVYGIVKQSGGHVSVRSKPGQGSLIRIDLPAAISPYDEFEMALSEGESDIP